MAKGAGLLLLGVLLGAGWLLFLYQITKGVGLLSMDLGEGIMDFIAVAAVSAIAFTIGFRTGWFVLLGWLAAQVGILFYDGLPKGRSPQMFMPTNAEESMLYAVVIVAVLNWSALPASIIGYFFGRAFPKTPKIRSPN